MAFHDTFTTFDLRVARHGSVATVMLSGEVDLATAPQLPAAVAQHRDADLLVVDLTEVTFIDSTGVRMLLEADRHCAGRGSRLIVVVGNGPVRRVLELCELDDRLAVVTDHPSRSNNGAPRHA